MRHRSSKLLASLALVVCAAVVALLYFRRFADQLYRDECQGNLRQIGIAIIAYEPLSNHGDGMNVLFGDGHIEFVDRARGMKLQAATAAGLPATTLPAK